MTAKPAADLHVTVQGDIDPRTARYARTKMRALVRYADQPVTYARVRITTHPDPAVSRPCIVQANIDLEHHRVRAQAAAASPREAIDLLHDRLRRQLVAHAEHWEARRGGVAQPSEWRHTSEPAHHPEHFPRSAEEREVVRRKTFALRRSTVDEAAFDMQMMDYQFQLFTEAGSGQDSVLHRADDGTLRLAQVHPRPDQITPATIPLEVSPHPAPRLTVDDARQRFDLAGRPFLFFQDADQDVDHGRGCLLYLRYDGHYGLISPA